MEPISCLVIKVSASGNSQPAIRFSKLTIETVEQAVKYVQS